MEARTQARGQLHQNKKQKIDLTVFRHLPAEILVHHLVPLIARDWLYVSREWSTVARVSLTSDPRVKFTTGSLMAVVANNDIVGVKTHFKSLQMSATDLCEAFIFACSLGYYQIVDLLLTHPQVDPHYGSDVAIKNAVINGDYQLLKRLVKGKHVDQNSFPAVMLAIKNGHYYILKLLLKDKRIDPSTNDNIAIINSVAYSQYNMVKLLLKDPRVDPSAQNNKAICKAARRSYQIAKLLVKDPRVDPSVKSNGALRAAIDNGQYKIVKLLMKDPRVDPSDNSHPECPPPIVSAVLNDNWRILKLLLKDPRSDPTAANNRLIRTAVLDNKLDLVQLLLQHPSTDPLGPDGIASEYQEHNKYATTIDIAAANDNLPMLQLLLADPRVNFLFWTGHAIQRLVQLGCFETAHTLLKDPRVVISKELFEKISLALRQQEKRVDLAPELGDFLDLLHSKRDSQ